MKTGQLYLEDLLLLPSVQLTETAVERARGLLFRSQTFASDGLIISPCNSVHSFFMGYSIDLVYLNEDLEVVKVCENFVPWRLSMCFQAKYVLELSHGKSSTLKINKGCKLIWKDH